MNPFDNEDDDYALRQRQAIRQRRELDWEELREAAEERRARFHGCKCGDPDWPGQCPGWRNCNVHGYGEEE